MLLIEYVGYIQSFAGRQYINTGFISGAVILQDVHIVDNGFEEDVNDWCGNFDSKCRYISDLQLFDGLSFFADD